MLSRGHALARDHTVVVNGIEVDIIETHAVTEADLDGLDDDTKLFIAGHRWALDTAGPVRIRATKHGGDIFDMFRLIEVFDTRGELRAELADAPFELGRLIAQVVRAEILANPPQAMRQMSPAGSTALDIDRIIDVMEPFAAALG